MGVSEPNSHSALDRWCVVLATCGGVGFSPVAPGTLGALLGVFLSVLLVGNLAPGLQYVVASGIFLLGFPICDRAAKVLGGEDPGAVIWDEMATMPFVFFLVPAAQLASPWVWLMGFGLHRLFDITKIPPARQAERFHGGTGIMLDDVVAAAYSCACLHVILFLG